MNVSLVATAAARQDYTRAMNASRVCPPRRVARWQPLVLLALLGWWSAPVLARCNVSTQPFAFGTYDPLSVANLDSSSTITVACNPKKDVDVLLDQGSGSYVQRTLRNTTTGEVLNYNLYTDTNRSMVWGDGSGGTDIGSANKCRRNQNDCDFMVYGRIPPSLSGTGQDVGVGMYTDTIGVTIIF